MSAAQESNISATQENSHCTFPQPHFSQPVEVKQFQQGPDDGELATSVSAPDSDHGAVTGDMELDLVLRQDRRDLRAAMAVFRRED